MVRRASGSATGNLVANAEATTDRRAAMPNYVTVSIEGDRIPWDAFASVSRDLHSILGSLDREMAGERTIEWVITKMSASSAKVQVSPSIKDPDTKDISGDVIKVCVTGLSSLDSSPERPAFFTDSMLNNAKNVSSSLKGRVEGITLEASVNGSREKTRVTQRVAANVDEVVGSKHTALGSVEGTLEVLSIHRGVHFNIYDTLTGKKIHCICDIDLLEELKDHMGERLLVEGTVRYNKYGEPTSIKADRYRELGARGELPQPRDMVGLARGKGLLRSDEVRRYMRGESDG